ncbi:integrase [Pseudomonas sp. PAMC 29040]|nr:integrase [Pseudomonas sp. PAMC 29040]
MGTVTVRKRKDGSTSYTAQIRIMQKDVTVYQESQTFDRNATAQAWIKGVETEMSVWLDEVNILLPGYEHAARIIPRP